MEPSGNSRAQRLTEAFDQFNQVSEQLSSSYRLLEQRLQELGGADHARPDRTADGGARHDEAGYLEAILDAMPAGIVVLDGDGVVQRCNAAAVDLLGSPLLGVAWREVIDRAFTSRRELEALTLNDGRSVALSTGPLGDRPGQVIVLNDVTGTRDLRSMVQRHERLSSMGEMVAFLAHQVRNPLASSLLYVSQLERAELPAPAQRRAVEKIHACLEHLGHVVDDMLSYARGGSFDSEALDVSELLGSVGELVAAPLQARRCRLQINDASAGAVLRGSRDALVAALQNLVSNAAEACAEQPGDDREIGLELSARRAGSQGGVDSVEILVRDEGPGIPPETRERIFDPFFTTKTGGTGLGLPVVKAIVQAHGGALWVDSEQGHGTTVGMRLPAQRAAADEGDTAACI